MSIQLYGQYSGEGSAERVSREIAWAFYRARLPVSGLKGIDAGIDHMTVEYNRVPPRFTENLNNAAQVGLIFGTVEKSYMWLKGHRNRLLYIFCETDRVPQNWLIFLNSMTELIVPSEFCKKAFHDSGVTVPITVIRHGISDVFVPAAEPKEFKAGHTFQFLHTSGALSFPARKATSQVLLAFSQIRKRRNDVWLHLQLRATPALDKALKELNIADRTMIIPFGGRAEWKQAYFYRSVDLVVQPSRGEGFGMVPLEARACGTPSAITFAHGHLEHAVPGVDIEVQTGPLQHMETLGNPRGRAPMVPVTAVRKAMETYLEDPERHTRRAEAWARSDAPYLWRWEIVLQPLVKKVRSLVKREPLVLGAHTGLIGADEI